MNPTRILPFVTAVLALGPGSLAEARYYDATVSEWLSPDPAGMPDGPDRYEYVTNRPTVGTDPRGLITLMLNGEPDASDIFDWWSEAQAQGMGSTLSSYADAVANITLTGSNGVVTWGGSVASNVGRSDVAGVTWPFGTSAAGACQTSWFIALFPSHSEVQFQMGTGDTGGGYFIHELRHAIDDATGRFSYPSGAAGEARALATEILFNEQISGDYMDSDWLMSLDPTSRAAAQAVLQDAAQRQLLMVQ